MRLCYGCQVSMGGIVQRPNWGSYLSECEVAWNVRQRHGDWARYLVFHLKFVGDEKRQTNAADDRCRPFPSRTMGTLGLGADLLYYFVVQ